MSNLMRYAVLRYTPSILNGESINLGLLVSADGGKTREFFHTKKWSRIQEFDDEANIDLLKMVLGAIGDEVRPRLMDEDKVFYIDEYVRYYANAINFSSSIELSYDRYSDAIEELRKIYLRYDFDKKHRLSRTDELRFLSTLLKSNGVKYERNSSRLGIYTENITYDFLFGDYGVKMFQFGGKDLKKVMNHVKAWAWNCSNENSLQTVILYSTNVDGKADSVDKTLLDTILRILHASSCRVYPLDDMQMIQKLMSKTQRIEVS